MIKRFGYGRDYANNIGAPGIKELPDGEYVRHDDYQTLDEKYTDLLIQSLDQAKTIKHLNDELEAIGAGGVSGIMIAGRSNGDGTYDAVPAAIAEPDPCLHCDGSGSIQVLSDNSPDAHHMDACCDHCGGSGSLADAATNLADDLAKEKTARIQLWDEYRNFHRSLSARFGYSHDPIHFRRDLVSLEEAIAAQISTEPVLAALQPPTSAQPSVPDAVYLGCSRMGLAGASDEEILNYVRMATKPCAPTPSADKE